MKNIDYQQLRGIISNETNLSIFFFRTDWCGECHLIYPMMKKMSRKYSNEVGIYDVDIDDNLIVRVKYPVREIPTILFYKDTILVDSIYGIISTNEMEEKINNVLPNIKYNKLNLNN